ncbi:MAG: zinc finger domain-containing protein [Candidatus Aenigmarchaeota archaeon]|nr:zinc finger domain-containing protein [Candidatus Aenigmarchaeota archaeon]
MVCSSCSISLLGDTNFVHFKCPKCGEVDIFRCSVCKKLSNLYKCSKCNFEGP